MKKVQVTEYIFLTDYQNNKKGDIINSKTQKPNYLTYLQRNKVICELNDKVKNEIFEQIRVEEENKEKQNAEKKEALKNLKNCDLTLYVTLDKDLMVKDPLTLMELCDKVSRKSNLNIKLLSDDQILDCLKQVNFDVLVNDKYETELSVKVVEKPLKSKSKMIGLKSTIVKDNEIILTGFGKENEATFEHKVIDETVEHMSETPSYDVDKADKINITLKKGKSSVRIDNPSHSKSCSEAIVKMDYLERKDVLEKDFFGKTFNDNLHIQLIYNILDIKKILAIYVEDINYVLCNLGRPEDSEDFMGNIKYKIPYEEFKDDKKYENFNDYFERSNKYYIYFNDVLSSKEFFNKKNKEKSKKEVYDILRILSLCRQFVKHSKDDYSLYQLDEYIDKYTEITELLEIVSEHYNNTIDKFNDSFVDSSKMNIFLIMNALGLDVTSKEQVSYVLNDYYKLIIEKSNTNLGFDFTRLRELVLEKLHLNINSNDKSGHYQIINYIIHYKLNEKIITDVVESLRNIQSEELKSKIYDKFSNEVVKLVKDIINVKLINTIVTEKKTKSRKYFSEFNLKYLLNTSDKDTMFDKMIYYLCTFLEPKGINMLVTALINKFSNIIEIIKVINELYPDEELEFADEYSLFNKDSLERYVSKLKVVLTLSRMKKNITKKIKKETTGQKVYNEQMYKDAYYLFGLKGDYKELHEDVISITGKTGAPKKTFKNFLLTTIINSNKFRYIVEYSNPQECCKIIKNRTIVKYVLSNMPDSQIKRYCESIEFYSDNRKEQINKLIDSLKLIDINYIKNNYDHDTDRIITLTGLYMAVLFIVVKQLVRINSYYTIAFSMLERDRSLFDYKELSNIDLDLVLKFIEKGKMNKRTCNYLLKNAETFNEVFDKKECYKPKDRDKAITIIYRKSFRNIVQHLNAVSNLNDYLNDYKGKNGKMNSYFELYQYIIQRVFFDEYKKETQKIETPTVVKEWEENVLSSGTYCRDMLHIITMPFAYNMARYKNLSIEDIFNDQYDEDLKIK